MSFDNRDYYEKYDWDQAKLSSKLKEKINILYQTIPDDVNTILDLGCGDGTLTNGLALKYKAIGTDRSYNSVKHVDGTKAQASADQLCFKNNSFDLVFSSEMIEHLPEDVFSNSIKEMKRISKKYIYLTFPNNENIEKQKTKCLQCGTIFNKSYHLRTINKKNIQILFHEYRVINEKLWGLKVRNYKKIIDVIKHKISPAESWIPLNWTEEGRRETMCPKCGHSFVIPYKFNIISFGLNLINILLSPKKPYQMFLLLEKKNV